MHTQFRNKNVDGRTIIKYFGCCSFKPARGAKQISPASRNKWVKIGIVIDFIIQFLLSKKGMTLEGL
jgi:hypothetical protein